MRQRSVLQVGDDLLDDRVGAVGLFGFEHRQWAVGEHCVVAVDGEQRALMGGVDVRDAPHDQPGGDLLGFGFGRERREGDLGDLSLADPLVGVLIPDGVGVLDRVQASSAMLSISLRTGGSCRAVIEKQALRRSAEAITSDW